MALLSRENSPYIGEKMLLQLKAKGVNTVNDFLNQNVELLAAETGLSIRELLAVQRILLAEYSSLPVLGVDLYEEMLTSATILSTGITELDVLLDGGFYSHEVTELFGPSGSGKTQLSILTAVHLSKTRQLSSLLISTIDSFPVQWMMEYAENNLPGKEVADILSRLMTVSLFDLSDVILYLHNLHMDITNQKSDLDKNLKLVVLDSAGTLVAPHLGRPQSEGMGLMGHLARALMSLAGDLGLVVLVINSATCTVSGELRPALGKYWSHVPSTRVQLETSTHDQRGQTVHCTKARLLKSSRQAYGSCAQFSLTSSS